MGIRQWPGNTRRFLREVSVEMQKVSWPNRETVIGSTIVVLIATFVLSVYMWGTDYVFGTILRWIIRGS